MSETKDDQSVEQEHEEEHIDPNELTLEERLLWLRDLPLTQGCFESPINLDLLACVPLELPSLEWVNFEPIPKKTKITNTGHTHPNCVTEKSSRTFQPLNCSQTNFGTQSKLEIVRVLTGRKLLFGVYLYNLLVIFSAKWVEERPYIIGGPFTGKYVFSNFHLHWGKNAMEGSEHTVDGAKSPLELHAIFFKSCYLTQESALKEQDGCSTLVYFFQLQDAPNSGFELIADGIEDITNAGTSKRIESVGLLRIIRQFQNDYFMYWGSVNTEKCTHFILWLITRSPIGISKEQLGALRTLLDHKGQKILNNCRTVKPLKKRRVFHVNTSPTLYSTLLPLSRDMVLQYYVTEVFYFNDMAVINQVFKDYMINSDGKKRKLKKYKSSNKILSTDEDDTSDK